MNDTSLLRGGRIDMDLWKLDPKVLSARMEVGLNSSRPASFATIYRGTPLPKDPATYEAMGDCSTEALPLYCFVPVEARGFRYILALASVVLKRITLAPDILGFVSSYTRDNPHAPVSAGSFQDALERAS
ncbi:hypothetical protein BDBG_17871 [Blastomyces gilchristii SLH14081]|uniref:Uncharacterized protein n=1 Tax=Blastomyces gilchristii (strain SLH14081) TaxID=559298 RepID=A0A179V0P1_BLAGS|nr:uncharacterized protein BDBG_17871 [Blastomyces gilchristii SLH14081]OAT13650.1 hypothetical protein BDBG_17871 [Blastomyces gilchristii SLH14081]